MSTPPPPPLLPYHASKTPSHPTTRTNTQVLLYLLCTDPIYHLLYILLLHISTTIIWDNASIEWIRAGLLHQNFDPWWSFYSAAHSVLVFEIATFMLIDMVRLIYRIGTAVQDEEGRWWEKVESKRVRRMMLGLVWMNILVSVCWICMRVCRGDGWRGCYGFVVECCGYGARIAPIARSTMTTTTTTTAASMWKGTTSIMPSSHPAQLESQL